MYSENYKLLTYRDPKAATGRTGGVQRYKKTTICDITMQASTYSVDFKLLKP